MKNLRLILSIMLSLSLLAAFVPGAAAGSPPGAWVSGISCVNLSASSQAMISLSFYQQNAAATVLTYNDPTPIPPNGTRGYYTPSSFASLGSFLGSVVVSSDQQLACNYNTQVNATGTSTDPYRMGSSAGFTVGAAAMFDPQVMKNYGGAAGNTWNSYMAVQNTSGGTITANVTYQDRNGNAVPAANESFSIPANTNHVFYQNDNAGLPNNFLGSAKVTATGGTLVLGAAFYNDGTSPTASQFQSFRGVATGASTVVLPRVVRHYYGYNSGVTVQNVGAAIGPNLISITFTIGGHTYVVPNTTGLASGASWALYIPNVSQLNGVDALPMNTRYGGATVTGPGGSSLVAIVNEDNRGDTSTSDGQPIPTERQGQGDTYNGVGLSDATTNEFFPQVTNNAGGIFSGGFNIANTTNTPTTCTITYGTSGIVENNVPLGAFGSIARYLPNVAGLPNPYNAGVSAHCGQNVVGIANLAVKLGSGKYGDSFTQSTGINQP